MLNKLIVTIRRQELMNAREKLSKSIESLELINRHDNKFKKELQLIHKIESKLYNEFIELDLELQEIEHQENLLYVKKQVRIMLI